jgi:hypothetical protein
MIMRRAFIVLLLIFGLVLPPVAASMSGVMAAPMEHCHKGKSPDHSPCCDTKSTCPAQLCALKSFKAVSAWGPPPLLQESRALDWPQEAAWPPGLVIKPEPPPPRV